MNQVHRFTEMNGAPQPSRRSLQLGRYRWVLAAAFCLASGISPAAGPSDKAALEAAVVQAETRLRQLEQLDRKTRQVNRQADSFEASGRYMFGELQAARDKDSAARDSLQRVTDCLQRLQDRLGAGEASIETQSQSVTQSQLAVKAVAQAASGTLAEDTGKADLAFARRASAERQLADVQAGIQREIEACQNAAGVANHQGGAFAQAARNIAAQAQSMPSQLQTLQAELNTTLLDSRSASDRQWLNFRAPAPALPDSDNLVQLAQAVSKSPPASITEIDISVLQTLGRAWADYLRDANKLARLEDAAAYLDLMLTGADECADCPSFAAERSELAGRIENLRQALLAARPQRQAQPAQFTAMLAPASDALLRNRQWLATMETPVAAAGEQASRIAGSVKNTSQALQQELKPAISAAQLNWENSHRLAYGVSPPDRSMAAMARPSPAPPSMGSAGLTPALVSHAYELFTDWNKERAGFGAYTYVLLRSASDLQQTEVLKRYKALLEVLGREQEASKIAAAEAQGVNLFCIPSKAPGTLPANGAAGNYADDLGHQLLLRAQSGLLTRPEVRKRLLKSAGPFLITLPGRIADAKSSTPLLFVDLGGYPEEVVADLLTQYKGDLLIDFPREQAVWQPPIRLRVALAMIRMADDTSELITSLVPSALADQPRR
jgi:hypothetical protein